jgi:hypothetical protein
VIEIANLAIALSTLVTAIGGLLLVLVKVKEVHDTTNSKMDQFIAEVRKSSFAAGRKSEKDSSAAAAEKPSSRSTE